MNGKESRMKNGYGNIISDLVEELKQEVETKRQGPFIISRDEAIALINYWKDVTRIANHFNAAYDKLHGE
jgi:hypothetical protein